MDEQCIADIASCIVGGTLIERSKDALDEIYTPGTPEANRVLTALEVYGSTKFAEEFKYCVDKMLLVCNEGKSEKLRKIVFETRTTNPFPSIFAILVIAFHELIVQDGKIVADLSG